MSDATPDWLAAPRSADPSTPAPAAAVDTAAPPPAPPAGWNLAAAATASNSSPTPGSPAPPAQGAPVMDTVRARAFAEWFVWARRHYAELPIAYAAARAAFNAAVEGADSTQAEQAGQVAVGNPAAAPAPLDARIESYAGWYAWAHLQMRAGEDVSHQAAAVASAEQARGARPEIVAQAAQQVVGKAAAERRQVPLSADPALRALVLGVLVLAVPIVSGLLFGTVYFFIWLPVGGVIYTFRTMGRSDRPLLAVLGLCLNGLAAVLTVLLIFLR